jgi:hypothetical protein
MASGDDRTTPPSEEEFLEEYMDAFEDEVPDIPFIFMRELRLEDVLERPAVNMATQPLEIPTDPNEWTVHDVEMNRLRSPLIIEYLVLLLNNPRYNSYASFTNRAEGLFRIDQPERVAALWQQVKGRQSSSPMTYDKFARAIRWCYTRGTMIKTQTRHTFQFSPTVLSQYVLTQQNS